VNNVLFQKLPKDWKIVKLRDIVDFKNGLNFSSHEKGKQGILTVDVLNMYGKSIYVDTNKLYRVNKNIKKHYLLKNKDILFVRSSLKEEGVGWASLFKDINEPVSFCGFIIRARLKQKDIFPEYMINYLRSNMTRKRLIANSGTVAITNINQDMLGKLKIPLPPLHIQKKIAAVLDKADQLRQKRKQAIEKLDQLLQSVFLDMFGDPVKNPKGWEVKKLEEAGNIRSGVTKGRKLEGKQTVEIPYMRVANVQDGYLDLSEIKTIKVTVDDVEKYKLEYGDVLFTEGGDPDKLGRGTVWKDDVPPPCIHQNHIFRVRVDPDYLVPQYLSALTGSALGKRYFFKSSKQTTGIASINSRQLKGCPVLLPPISLQQKFNHWIDEINNEKTLLQKSKEQLDTLFNSLLQKAFRGELTFNDSAFAELEEATV